MSLDRNVVRKARATLPANYGVARQASLKRLISSLNWASRTGAWTASE